MCMYIYICIYTYICYIQLEILLKIKLDLQFNFLKEYILFPIKVMQILGIP